MPSFSAASERQIATLHPDLQRVLREAIKYFDFTVLEGHRGKEAQDAAVAKGASKTPWPTSKHNKLPSLAVDIAPYPVDWREELKALERFSILAGVIHTVAQQLGVNVRWGHDWNQNWDTRDENGLQDRPHFELVL
ncbi:MAG TPA: M15 family metallopeptidase [Gemmatimonadaceae bacterium]